MKTGAMRRFVGIDLEGGSEPGKAMRIAKKLGHGIESVSCNITCLEPAVAPDIKFYFLMTGGISSSHSTCWSRPQRLEQTRERKYSNLNVHVYKYLILFLV